MESRYVYLRVSIKLAGNPNLLGRVHAVTDEGAAKDVLHSCLHLSRVAHQGERKVDVFAPALHSQHRVSQRVSALGLSLRDSKTQTHLLLGLCHHAALNSTVCDLVERDDGNATLELALG